VHKLKLVIGVLLLLGFGIPTAATESRWEGAIRAFEMKDKASPPTKDVTLFVGSSSIVLWDLPKWFPDLPTVNRGFGGSQIADSIEFATRIVIPHKPKAVVFYAGDNDVDGGKTPQTVFEDYKRFVRIIRADLPETRIIFVAIKPSIARWNLVEQMREANALIREETEKDDLLEYVDIDKPMIGEDGKPCPDLLLEDGLHLNDAGYKLWTSLLMPYLKTTEESTMGKLLVATCQFPVSATPAENADWISKQMSEASDWRADVVHFPEVALSGYSGVDRESLDGFDWDAQRAELESILVLAKELGLWVVLGCAHPLTGENKPHNSLYVVDPEGRIVDRYDKRFCTGGDLKHYSPGDRFVTFEVKGVKCGLLICYDVRFPELFRQYHKLGVQLLFHSFYNARQKEGSIHPKIMPPSCQARAATNSFFMSVNNSCAPRSWESLFITPDGLIEKRLEIDTPGVMVNLVDTTKKYYDASKPYRLDCIDGKWNSGEVVEDPRSSDRECY
jgi:predicted amidohydrolase/lysophospholipase L1-like esterase